MRITDFVPELEYDKPKRPLRVFAGLRGKMVGELGG